MARTSRASFTIAAGALGAAGLALVVTRDHPATTWYGGTLAYEVVAALAGVSLGLAGALWSAGGPRRLAVGLAGVALSLQALRTPDTRSSAIFTAGLLATAWTPWFVALVLLLPRHGWPRRAPLLASLLAAGLPVGCGVVATVAYDPRRQGCSLCPRNALDAHDAARVVADGWRLGLRVGAAGLLLTAIVALAAFARRPRAAEAVILVPGLAYLVGVLVEIARSLDRDRLVSDVDGARLHGIQAAALLALAVGVAWRALEPARIRRDVARQVLDGMAGGELSADAVLQRALDDRGARIAYARDEAGASATPLVRDGQPVAWIVHDVRHAAEPERLEAVVAGLRAVIEHERLRAEAESLVAQLQASREQIVAVGDEERRRLERSLHDGAQQRIIALMLEVGIALARAQREGDAAHASRLSAARRELQAALDALRDVSHGLHPAVLDFGGLRAAVVALAERGPTGYALDDLSPERLPPQVEAVAYLVVAEVTRGATHATVAGARHADAFGLRIAVDGAPAGDVAAAFVDLDDRVGALGGRLEHALDDRGARIVTVWLPCVS